MCVCICVCACMYMWFVCAHVCLHIIVYACVCACRCMCVCSCTCVCFWRLDIFLSCSHLDFREKVSHLPGTCQFGWTPWPMSLKVPHVSISLTGEAQTHATAELSPQSDASADRMDVHLYLPSPAESVMTGKNGKKGWADSEHQFPFASPPYPWSLVRSSSSQWVAAQISPYMIYWKIPNHMVPSSQFVSKGSKLTSICMHTCMHVCIHTTHTRTYTNYRLGSS